MENEIKEQEVNEQEEVIEEQPSPETEEASEPVAPITYSSDYLQKIEDARVSFLKVYRTQNSFKWVVSAICIAAVIFACIFIPQLIEGTGGTVAMVSILVGALGGTLCYSIFTKKSMEKKMKAYFGLYYDCVNHFVFDNENISNLKSQFPGKIEKEVFTDNNLFKDVNEVGSRGLSEFEYKGVPIAICDAAAQTVVERRAVPVFVGKYLYSAANFDYDDPVYIYFRGDKRSLPPTNMDGIKAVLDDKKMIVYSNNKDWKKVLTPEVKKIFSKIEMNKELVDLSISFQKGRMFVCMGYDDPLMVLPLQHQFDPKPNEQFKRDVYNILDLIKEFN